MALTKAEISSITISRDRHASDPAWDAFVTQSERGTVFHAFGWKRVFEFAYGNECFYLKAEAGGAVVGVFPLVLKKSRLFGKFLVSLPYFDHAGICCERTDVREALLRHAQELARDLDVEYVEIRHANNHELDLPTKQSKVSMTLKLPANPEDLWRSLKAKVRNQVRKAEGEGLTLCQGKDELLDDFFDTYVVNMRDLGSPSHSKHFFECVLQTFPEDVRIFCVRHNGDTVAAGFTLTSKDTLTIPWASSLRAFNAKCPNMLLYWGILKYACEAGFSVFNFGRSTPGEGTYRFKKQWGGEPRQLYWQYWMPEGNELPELNTDNSKYGLPIKVWKKLPVAVTRSIGPRLIGKLA